MSSSLWVPERVRLSAKLNDDDFAEFQRLTKQTSDPADYPLAETVTSNIPVYSTKSLQPLIRGEIADREKVMAELQRALSYGPGFFVMRGMIDGEVIDGAEKVTAEVRKADSGFGSVATSMRTFSYSEKHARCDPESFADYYANDTLAMVCETWLGPGYQITAMTNAITKTEKQGIHRDYHLSSQADERIRRFPLINQMTSQLLTLQAAIAHTDMPIAAGPTRFLPFSQQYHKGYMAFKRAEYVEYTKQHMVQLELKKGDAVFFNPALFHQPGDNTLETPRVANLLQVSACWGRPMETNDRLVMMRSVWPAIKRRYQALHADGDKANGVNGHAHVNGNGNGHGHVNGHKQALHPAELEALILATGDDYGYPQRMDSAPQGRDTQAGLIRRALKEGWTDEKFVDELEAHDRWHH